MRWHPFISPRKRCVVCHFFFLPYRFVRVSLVCSFEVYGQQLLLLPIHSAAGSVVSRQLTPSARSLLALPVCSAISSSNTSSSRGGIRSSSSIRSCSSSSSRAPSKVPQQRAPIYRYGGEDTAEAQKVSSLPWLTIEGPYNPQGPPACTKRLCWRSSKAAADSSGSTGLRGAAGVQPNNLGPCAVSLCRNSTGSSSSSDQQQRLLHQQLCRPSGFPRSRRQRLLIRSHLQQHQVADGPFKHLLQHLNSRQWQHLL